MFHAPTMPAPGGATEKRVHGAGDDRLRLLNDILDFSALDPGRIRFEDVVFAPTAMVEMTAGIARRSATAEGPVTDTGHNDDAAEAAIIDPTTVDEFVAQVGCDATDEIVTVFLSETERRLGVLRGLPVDDLDAIRQEVHTLKGSSGTFGLVRLSMLSRKLERGASGIAPDDYHAALDALDDVFVRSRRELNIYLRKICENYAEFAE
jgi:HPt (histidine-containing phosphotransfer) domain-containing protein